MKRLVFIFVLSVLICTGCGDTCSYDPPSNIALSKVDYNDVGLVMEYFGDHRDAKKAYGSDTILVCGWLSAGCFYDFEHQGRDKNLLLVSQKGEYGGMSVDLYYYPDTINFTESDLSKKIYVKGILSLNSLGFYHQGFFCEAPAYDVSVWAKEITFK